MDVNSRYVNERRDLNAIVRETAECGTEGNTKDGGEAGGRDGGIECKGRCRSTKHEAAARGQARDSESGSG